MAATSSKPVQPPKSTSSPAPTRNASARLEKSHPGVRRSTPDSEALASSDDDLEHPQRAQPSTTAPPPKPARRTSWLNEVPPSANRKTSLPAANPLSSAPSNPTSPVTDQNPWGANTSPGIGGSIPWSNVGSGSFPWGAGIWNTESRKEPPPRLSELVPSPTMTNAPAGNPFGDEMLSPTARTMSGDSNIPFSIPLHPTPKTYRSQSYSVGQLDPEYLALMANKSAVPNSGGRARNSGPLSSLQRRSSRPSVLGELGHDPAMLGRVREDEDDGASPTGSDGGGAGHSVDQARTIEQLARENALLRQAAGNMDNRLRDRTTSSASANSGYAAGSSVPGLNRIRGSVPEEADLAVEDLDELGDIPGYNNMRRNTRRRLSEQSANLEQQFPTFASLENRNLENVRKGHWQTTLGFGGMADIPQSRRHSFADVPMRHPSVSSVGESQAGPRAGLPDREDGYANIGENALPNVQGHNREFHRFHSAHRSKVLQRKLEYLRACELAEPYLAREQALRDGPSGMPSSLHQAYAMSNAYGRQQPPLGNPHQNQLLYIVTFKCHRADVFYIQEDTGLQVKQGDLVIVEADRGTDLGTIQYANVSLQKARELKQQYAEEHYKWLMMFSRQGQNGTSNVVNTSGAISGLGGRSAIGGMGPHGPHGAPDTSADIKPKLIKRLAQNHEILTLRDKEGNEAKAKRVCQQKVAEHRLNMEILDAEFQM